MHYRNFMVISTKIVLQCDTEKKGYLSIDDLQVAMVAILGYKACKVGTQASLTIVNL